VIFAYADPPYPGCAHLYPEKREVDHAELVARLVAEYPDGWALSTSSPALKYVLGLCPDEARVMPWVKPFAIFKPGVGVAYAWEPVIVMGGRRRTREQPTVPDWVSANITLRRGLTGAKPDDFCYRLFEWLNITDEDELHDLFPGTKAVTDALAAWRRQRPLPLAAAPGASPAPRDRA
jgi:hypothetical protein